MKCVICDKPCKDMGADRNAISISRCCCDQDYVCLDCVKTKSLADYIVKAVSISDALAKVIIP